jgi:small GTP-binding protein
MITTDQEKEAWAELLTITESITNYSHVGSAAFHPHLPVLATLGDEDRVVRIWELESGALLDRVPKRKIVSYTSAKIVLVGESNVGKSCLAMRLAEDRYPDDHEHGTTHGMRFWPMEAEKLHPASKPPEGQRRDVVLWDFGGQDEYQLVHQMFLHDTTLALVLIDPTRGRAALDEARDWNKRLEKHLGKDRAVKLLVGAKVDDARKKKLIDQHGIDGLCKECGFVGFLDLSARTGRNTKQLRKLISDALDWDQMAKTSRPELFQAIRDEIEKRRRADEIVIVFDEFDQELHTNDELEAFNLLHHEIALDSDAESGTAALRTVCKQLADQGIIVQTKLMNGDEALVLQLPVIERYAGSLIIAARNNPRGVPVLEERLLGSTRTIPLPGMTKKERLSAANERMVLECIVELMIQHGICFRHGGLLVFPTLFPASGTDDEKLPHSISLYYDFTGAIDNIYASLVSKLMVSEEFGEGRLRAGRVEFESGRQGVCGVRQIKRTGGLAHVDLFFSEKTKPDRKDLFTRFVEEHLRLHGVDIREHEAMTCQCGEQISERIVQTRISAGEKDVVCPICERKTLIGEGVDRIRKRSPETDAKMVALRKRIDEKLAEDIKSAKKVVAGEIRAAKTGDPIRILHLSDLHFTDKMNPDTKLKLLLQDIRQPDEQYAAIEAVEYLVISGDMTDKGHDVGFEKARQFVESLVNELGLSVERCIFVPGNHDVQDRADAYEQREGVDGKPMLVRHPENFQKRFLQFSNGFFHPLMHREYPLRYADQGISYLFPETGIQFLTLNSAWEIDKNGRKKAGIHPDAVAGVIDKADDERRRAIERDDLKKNQPILRIGVWHHAVAGPELMPDLGFLTQLQKAGMQLCLHGDVHEARTELYGHRRPGTEAEILGAGSFGSLAEGRPESTPKLYNMLEVVIDPATKKHKSIRVHTRQQKKENEAWQGYHEWPNPGGGRLPYFDIDFKP